jgi:hypothetical protein
MLVVLRIKVHHFLDLHMFMMQIWIVRLFSQVFINKKNKIPVMILYICICFFLTIHSVWWMNSASLFLNVLGVCFLFMHLSAVLFFCIIIYMNALFFVFFQIKKILLIGIYKYLRAIYQLECRQNRGRFHSITITKLTWWILKKYRNYQNE